MVEKRTSLIICILPEYMDDTQENWITPWNDASHHLKYYFQLKTKDDFGGIRRKLLIGVYQEKQDKQG